MSVQLSLTKLQWEEITHKLYIISEEPDLQESYNLDQREATTLYDRFYHVKPVGDRYDVEVSVDEIDVLIGEIENVIEIASANIEHGDDGWRGIRSSMGRVLKKLQFRQTRFSF